MAVTGGGFVDRAEQVEVFDDAARSEIVAGDNAVFVVRGFWIVDEWDLFGDAIDDDGALERLVVADSVGEADEDFMSSSSAKIIDGNAARHVGGGAVDFGRIFAGESAATNGDARTVIVDDKFAAGESGVGFETALVPIASRVQM